MFTPLLCPSTLLNRLQCVYQSKSALEVSPEDVGLIKRKQDWDLT